MIFAFNRINKLLLYASVLLAGLVGYSDTARAQNSLTATPASLQPFTFQIGGATPAPQSLTIASTGASVPVNATVATPNGASVFTIAPASGMTPALFNVSANPAGLAAGTYTGTISVSSPSLGSAPLSIPLSLVVSAPPTLTISQNNVQFYYQTGQANPAQTVINLASSSTPLGYSVTSTTASGGGWLVVGQTGGITPSSLTIGANPAGLLPGVYNGTVTIATVGSSAPAQTINVSLTVAANPLAIPSPNSIGFTYQLGGVAPATQTVTVTSTMPGTPLNFATGFTPADGSPNFLTIAQSGPATPATLTLTASTAGLTPGTYSGQLSIVTAGNSAVMVPVTLTVGNNPLLTFSQPAATFNFQIGTAPPVPQTLSVGSTGAPLNFTAAASTTSGGSFLTVSSGGTTPGTTPGTLTIAANPAGLAVGTYTGSVTVTPAGSTPQSIPVTLTVSNTPLVNINPAALNFTASVVGGTPPPFQMLALTSTGDPVPFTATASGGPFLVVTPASGNAPANLSVGVNPTGLAVGTYTGSITVIAGGQTQMVPVTLVVNSGINVAVTPAALTFMQVAGGAAPANQTINVTSTNGSVPISAVVTTGMNFLTVMFTAATPGTVTVSANAGMLAAGTYMGSITVTGTGAANGPQVIPVTLTVTAPAPVPTLTATPTPINISAVAGGPNPANAAIAIAASGGAAVPFTVTAAAASGGTW
ncbi:MAG: hypothetical protein M3Z85_19000, partial [Acidobacteriota bacterium]|nr:hypothetical protein [Acidobacteriota bacterium]